MYIVTYPIPQATPTTNRILTIHQHWRSRSNVPDQFFITRNLTTNLGYHPFIETLNPTPVCTSLCALFIATQNSKLRDDCKDIWHVPTQDENGGKLSGQVAQTMNCVTM